ncbi:MULTISPECIES: outer membrane protein assembly factor BamE [unclassified Pseudomonas]|uniref:outer membrane protein assembly factor BamE domain-containing protein n=1 Tax=unclassified Pseudomonas TaxID=196821 RepID=UPI001AE9C512|nr:MULTISPECIES: outer membrane protein assembly factor BamE [unclassified Pseudomonas]HDS1695768.1 outer membrane protein assembly factor BamE [Pseudomonas putida]MBP2270807.1 outer membrane protein assembly factor BamE (lipoprotein component of BamABCDE complex) [Pseudomonas sp. BP6]MBP2284910.1 outer membrane protein assembly factor BamE (lipoprotein component of BamABCDE complex) [Pseudomonas sp. BP7]MBP2290192.1 outer membrane protein assembly factor BamE (lipoprotein component of BamABCDE
MLRHIHRFLLAAVLVGLAGCAGTPFTFGQASQVKVGMTEDQLYEIMGNPYMVVSQEDGQRFIYTHATAFSGAKSVSFETKDGKVTKVPYIPKDYIAKPSPDE